MATGEQSDTDGQPGQLDGTQGAAICTLGDYIHFTNTDSIQSLLSTQKKKNLKAAAF